MDIIINLPSIGRAILRDFYIEGARLWQFLSVYTSAFLAVGTDLFPNTAKSLQGLTRQIKLPSVSINFKPKSYLPQTQMQKITTWYEEITKAEDSEEDSIPRQLIFAIIGIFVLGCAWFTLMMLYTG